MNVEVTKKEIDSISIRLSRVRDKETELVLMRESLNYNLDKIKEKYKITTELISLDVDKGVLTFADKKEEKVEEVKKEERDV